MIYELRELYYKEDGAALFVELPEATLTSLDRV